MNFTCLLFGAAFVLFGALFAHGNLHTHLKAWTRMPADEKEKIKIKPLCRNVGGMIAACGGVFLLAGVSPFFSLPYVCLVHDPLDGGSRHRCLPHREKQTLLPVIHDR